MNYELKNEELQVEIASFGAELRKVTDVKTGKDYLWNADKKYWGRVSPVLFPVVGNYFEHESIYDGKTYQLGQHGFARDTEFELVEQTATSIRFRMNDTEETRKSFPFAFVLELGYELSGRELKVLWTVKNTDDKIMYFSIGAHPAFLSDLTTDALKFDTFEDLDIEFLDDATGCVGDKTETMPLDDGVLPMSPELFNDGVLILGENQTHDITLLDGDAQPKVQVSFDAPVVGIWTPAKMNAPFVCIEPWYGRTDRNDFNKKLEEREYGNSLAAGEVFDASYSVRFF